MSARLVLRGAALAAAFLFAACGSRGGVYTAALKPLPLVATSAAVVQVVPQTRRAVILTPGEATPGALRLSAGARSASRVPGAELVAVLAGTAKAPLLDVVDVGTGEVTTLAVPGFFDRVTWSDDGAFGVLSYAATAPSGQLIARNLNEVGLFAVASRTVVRLQLDTESLAPRDIVFGPAQANRRLVAVTLERGVALFDALHPDVPPRRISIRPQGSTSESIVAEAVFSADAHWLFLRATGLDDVIVVELGDEVGAPLSASINFVSGGRGLTDIAATPELMGDTVLAVYATSREVWLLDARGIQDNARRLVAPAPVRTAAVLSGTRVLLWDAASQSLTAWDMLDGRSGTVTLDGTFSSSVVLPEVDRAVFALPGAPALSEVTVVPETNRLRLKLQSIQLTRPYAAAALDPATRRLFFTAAGTTTVVTMDLMTLALAEVTLDAPAARLAYLSQGDWLVAEHDGSLFGDVTVVPAGTTERSGARRYVDFAFTDDLELPGDAP